MRRVYPCNGFEVVGVHFNDYYYEISLREQRAFHPSTIFFIVWAFCSIALHRMQACLLHTSYWFLTDDKISQKFYTNCHQPYCSLFQELFTSLLCTARIVLLKKYTGKHLNTQTFHSLAWPLSILSFFLKNK